MTPPGPELHVFIIRARREPRERPDAPPCWKFWIEHQPSGQRHYFRTLDELLAFIDATLPRDAREPCPSRLH